ncbi:MAG: hypothetical protein IKP67_02540 [Spirochaetales bacterium]|nr:hypothetical protein [Spirochaetales bacterium]
MPYIILFVVIFIFLGFTLLFQWLVQDNIKQYYIAGLTLFYALCTLIRRCSAAANFIGNLTHGWALIIYALSLVLSIWCAVGYLMNIIPDQRFRAECGIFMLAELIVFIVAAVLRYYKIQCYMQVFYVSILIISILSVAMTVYYTVKCWPVIQWHNRILLIITLIMIVWFVSSLVLNLRDSQYVYFCGSGILLYFLAYTAVSAMRLHHNMTARSRTVSSTAAHNAYSIKNDVEEQNYDDYNNLLTHLTQKEQQLLDIMSQYKITNTKDILEYLPDNTTENGINTALSRLMKKFNAKTREELITLYSAAV